MNEIQKLQAALLEARKLADNLLVSLQGNKELAAMQTIRKQIGAAISEAAKF